MIEYSFTNLENSNSQPAVKRGTPNSFGVHWHTGDGGLWGAMIPTLHVGRALHTATIDRGDR